MRANGNSEDWLEKAQLDPDQLGYLGVMLCRLNDAVTRTSPLGSALSTIGDPVSEKERLARKLKAARTIEEASTQLLVSGDRV